MGTHTSFTTTVQQYDDTEDLFIEIPHYILQNLDWEENDELAWSIKGNQIILTKITNTSSIKEEPTMSDYDWYTEKDDAIKNYLNIESEGKEYKNNEEIAEHFFQDYDEKYDQYIQATNEETYGDQGNEQSKD